MKRRQLPPPSKESRPVKLRLARCSLLVPACPPARAAGEIEGRRRLRHPQRLPAGRHSRRDRRHHLVRPGRAARDAAAIDVTATITNCSRNLQRDAATGSLSNADVRRGRGPPRRRPGAPGRAALFRRRACRAAARSSPSAIGQVALNFPAGEPARPDPRPGDGSGHRRAAATLPEDVRADPDPRRKAGDADAAIDPMTDPGGPRRGRQRDLRASGRLPADPGAAALQRHALGARLRLTQRAGAAKARRVIRRASGDGRTARESSSRPSAWRRRRSNRPRNLSGTRTARA